MSDQGRITRELHKDLEQEANRVEEEGMFDIQDLAWIAPCLETSIRLTIEAETHAKILAQGGNVERDSIFGQGDITVHLLLSWVSNGQRLVGHYDLLQPRAQTLFSHLLPPDVAWPK